MLEKIKSLKSERVLNLLNPCAKYIYDLDSINLIIGNNGTGKTTLIKSIISDLTSNTSPDEFIAEGSTDSLGIIYYSATPFHKPMKSITRDTVAFIDASAPQKEKQNFVKAANEYLATSKLLKLHRNLRSVQFFDLPEACFSLTKQLHIRARELPFIDDDLLEAHTRYRRANNKYLQTNRRINTFNDHPSTYLRAESDFFDEHSIVLQNLHLSLEEYAKNVIEAKEDIYHAFMRRSAPLDEDSLINWIATSILLENRNALFSKTDLAIRMYTGEINSFESETQTARYWHSYREKIKDFIRLLNESNSGSLKLKREQIELSVNTPKLMRANGDPQIVETAHKLGLVNIGFDTMSSGQAAIMHQMISISHSIQELKALGKKNILIFIDEGDLLLHLNWQREYIYLIDQRLSNFKKGRDKLESLQVVIASHSPMLASDILRDSITRLDEGNDLPSFGAPIQQIINYSFGTPSMGLVAQSAIERLKVKDTLSDPDIEVANQIDDDFIRAHLLKKAGK